jgi:hypothetical protein
MQRQLDSLSTEVRSSDTGLPGSSKDFDSSTVGHELDPMNDFSPPAAQGDGRLVTHMECCQPSSVSKGVSCAPNCGGSRR